MKSQAQYLVRYGDADKAFELRDHNPGEPGPGQLLVEVETFGINFADVMARKGLYKAAPPNPAVLGYEVVGKIAAKGSDSGELAIGTKVLAFTRFGGYATHTLTDHRVVVPVPEGMDNGTAAALGTQYVTAIHAAYDMANMQAGEHVLIHAAAGGVGTALVQLAKHRGCIVYGTSSSAEKIAFMKANGVDHGINYIESDFSEEIRKIRNGKGLDVVIDPIGGSNFKKSLKLLEPGGRIVGYGASDQLNRKGAGIISKLKLVFGFGFMHPVPLIVNSRGVLGVNLLKIADNKPEVILRCMREAMKLAAEGVVKPIVGKVYDARDIAEAHAFIESRKSTGKIVLNW